VPPASEVLARDLLARGRRIERRRKAALELEARGKKPSQKKAVERGRKARAASKGKRAASSSTGGVKSGFSRESCLKPGGATGGPFEADSSTEEEPGTDGAVGTADGDEDSGSGGGSEAIGGGLGDGGLGAGAAAPSRGSLKWRLEKGEEPVPVPVPWAYRVARRVPLLRQLVPLVEIVTRPIYLSDVRARHMGCPLVTSHPTANRLTSYERRFLELYPPDHTTQILPNWDSPQVRVDSSGGSGGSGSGSGGSGSGGGSGGMDTCSDSGGSCSSADHSRGGGPVLSLGSWEERRARRALDLGPFKDPAASAGLVTDLFTAWFWGGVGSASYPLHRSERPVKPNKHKATELDSHFLSLPITLPLHPSHYNRSHPSHPSNAPPPPVSPTRLPNICKPMELWSLGQPLLSFVNEYAGCNLSICQLIN